MARAAMTTVPDAATTPAPRTVLWAAAAFLAAYAGLGIATLSGDHYWGDDWAQYVLHARNLVTGHDYPDTGYLFNPDFPSAGPATYPPGLPLVLAPAFALFGLHIFALKVPILVCLTLALPVAYAMFAPVIGRVPALLAVALLAMHPHYWGLHQLLLSEAPYILASLTALWYAQRAVSAEAKAAFLAGAGLGLLVFAAVMCRSIGVALLPAVVVHGWARRHRWTWFAGLAIAVAVPLAIVSSLTAPPPTYQAELRAPSAAQVLTSKPLGYLNELAELLPGPSAMSKLPALAFVGATLVGIVFLVWRPARALPRADLRGLASRVPVFLWYLGAYVAALFLASIGADHRLLLPILPIAIALAVHGVAQLGSMLPHSRLVLIALGMAAIGYVVALDFMGRGIPRGQMATCRDCLEMFTFMREKTPPDSVVVFNKPRAMALLGGRRAWVAAPRYTGELLERRAQRAGANYIVTGTAGSEFAARYPTPDAVRDRTRAPDAQVVFRNREFEVTRLGATVPQ